MKNEVPRVIFRRWLKESIVDLTEAKMEAFALFVAANVYFALTGEAAEVLP